MTRIERYRRKLIIFLALGSMFGWVSMDGSFPRPQPDRPAKLLSPGECFERKVASGEIILASDPKKLADAERELDPKRLLAVVIQPPGLSLINPCP